MSCSDPDDNECLQALERMVFFIDRELDEADSQQIREHLEDCAPCLGSYDLERTVKALVARSCSESAPEELRTRVMFRIREVHLRIGEDQP